MLATEMGAKKIAVIDTENSAALYDGKYDFDVCEIPSTYKGSEMLKFFESVLDEAIEAGYECIIIDSLSHIWDACLELKDKLGGRFQDWAKVTPRLNQIIGKIVKAPCHIITTMRAKTDTQLTKNDDGKLKVETHGLTTHMRSQIEYEFTIIFRMNMDHSFNTVKDRTGLFDDAIDIQRSFDKSIAKELIQWLNKEGDNPKPKAKKQPEPVRDQLTTDILAAQKSMANEFLKAIEALEEHSDGLELSELIEAWIEDKKIPDQPASYLREKMKSKLLEIEAEF
jgi:hypothetical protein